MIDRHLEANEIEALQRGASLPRDRADHADSCPYCTARTQGNDEVWDLLEEAVPTPRTDEMWRGIADYLGRRRWLGSTPARAAAAASIVTLAVVASWTFFGGDRQEPRHDSLAVAEPSAARRLAAVVDLEARGRPADAVPALMTLLESDPDEHVRIAALDALGDVIIEGHVPRSRLLPILERERSPLVQSDLLDLLLKTGGAELLPTLRRALPRETTHPFVLAQLETRS